MLNLRNILPLKCSAAPNKSALTALFARKIYRYEIFYFCILVMYFLFLRSNWNGPMADSRS